MVHGILTGSDFSHGELLTLRHLSYTSEQKGQEQWMRGI